jgi:hypothetical protein
MRLLALSRILIVRRHQLRRASARMDPWLRIASAFLARDSARPDSRLSLEKSRDLMEAK